MGRIAPFGLLCLAAASAWATPPELPRILMDTTYRTPTGNTTAVNSGGNLQTAIDNASCGDVLSLEAGAIFTGNFSLPNKDCTDDTYVIIRTSTPDGTFPRPGNRVGPSHASLMAKLTAGSNSIITNASGADHYRFIGLEITPSAYLNALVELSVGSGNLTTQPNHIIFDRCYIHGHATNGSRRGIAAQGAYIAVVDSYLSDFKEAGADTQAFSSWNGTGPFKLVNNYLEASGENLSTGGSDNESEVFIPSDIEFRRNYLSKPLDWKASGDWQVKNLFETKEVKRLLIEGNLFENSWGDAQNGIAILFTVVNPLSSPWVTIQDVTFRGNMLQHVAGGFNLVGEDQVYESGAPTARIDIRHNLIADVTSTTWNGPGALLWSNYGPIDVVLEHNTTFSNLVLVSGYGSPAATGHVFRYNVSEHGVAGYVGQSEPCNLVMTSGTFFTSPVVTDNVLQGAIAAECSSYYDASNAYPVNMSDVGFVNLGAEDYRLDSGSDYYAAGDAGSDLGAWIPAATTALSQLDWSVEVEPAYTGARVTFGVPGLPYNQSCTVRYGASSTTSSTGPSRRTVVLSGLTPTQAYFIGIDCGTTWGGWLSWDNYTATTNPGGTKTVPFSIRPPATLSTVARAKVECSMSSDMSDPVSAQDTSCTSAAVCEVNVAAVPVGLNYCRHIYQTSGDVAVATSAVEPISVQ